MNEKLEIKWMGKNSRPSRAGWHYTRNHDGSLTARYFDDSNNSWWRSTAANGWVPNDSFVTWLTIPDVSDQQT
jgi:hypothetical protein